MNNLTPKYLLDTNVFIEASKRCYAFDLVSTFWKQLTYKSQEGIISSIDKVRAEISHKNKQLTDWADEQLATFWESTIMHDTKDRYQKLMEWADTPQQYSKNAIEEFATTDRADAWLIAHALAKGRVIVTEEKYNAYIKKRIPIPNVCESFDIRYSNRQR